jgi:hypothetical protein
MSVRLPTTKLVLNAILYKKCGHITVCEKTGTENIALHCLAPLRVKACKFVPNGRLAMHLCCRKQICIFTKTYFVDAWKNTGGLSKFFEVFPMTEFPSILSLLNDTLLSAEFVCNRIKYEGVEINGKDLCRTK